MKIVLTPLFFFLIINFSFSQVTLAKQYDKNEYLCSYSNFEGVNLYATYNSETNQINIYDENHQNIKSMTYKTDEYLNRVFIYGLSTDVFNLNDNIEFLMQTFTGKGKQNVVLIDDQHNIIQEFKNASIRTIGNKNYILESDSESSFDQNLQEARTYQTDKLYLIKGKFRKIKS